MTTDKQFKRGQRRGPSQTLLLADCYNAVFTMRQPTREALDMVLNDLAEFSGYFAVPPPGTSNEAAQYFNGQRSVFARILSLSKLSGQEREQLREAALIEMQISNAEGER